MNFQIERIIGILLIYGSLLLFIPYTILTIIVDYPDMLREETGFALTKFHEGGSPLIWFWWAFAMVGLPLLGAVVLIGQKLGSKVGIVRLATVFGIIGLIAQVIGLLHWGFLVPVLADNYVTGNELSIHNWRKMKK